MEKRKANHKKLIAILCIFAILHSYFFTLLVVVQATSDFMIGGENSQINEDFFISSNENNEKTMLGGEDVVDKSTNEIEDEESNEPVQNENDENPFQRLEIDNNELEESIDLYEDNNVLEENENNQELIPTLEENWVEPQVNVEVTSDNLSIYKGYLYANATSELKYATNYNTVNNISILGGKSITRLSIQDEPDKMQTITGDKIGLMSQMYYKQTRVLVEDFENILGTDGEIMVYTPEGEILGTINKNSEIKDGEYYFTYPMYLNSVRFELINIKNDGNISIRNDKAIKETADFSRRQISLFSAINTITQVHLYVGEELKATSYEGNINLEETESKMVLDVDTNTLTVEGNNELAIMVTLKTDEERYDLFENPTIDLEFPSAIDSLEVTGITLLYKNGLSIDNWEITTNSVGRKVLKISLAGSQLEYTPGAVQEGTTIVVYTNVDVNRLTADTQESLRMTYTNKDTLRKTYSLEGRDFEEVNLNFVGRQELVRAMEIKTSDENKKTSYDDEAEKIQIEANKEQVVNVKSSIVNNYETTINDVVIIGRVPFVGNKDMEGNDLGTNFDSVLQNKIATTGVVADVYYSLESNAEINSNSWTQEIEDFNLVKSYKIVLKEKDLVKGERLSFEYNLGISESVGKNAKGYTNYVVYYKIDNQNYYSQCLAGIYTEEKEIELEDIKQEEMQKIAELTIGTQVSQCGIVLGELDSVFERQVLKYTVVVRNTSNITANNVVIKANAENANIYGWNIVELNNYQGHDVYRVKHMKEFTEDEREFEEFKIGNLEPNESKTIEYEVIVKDLSEIQNPEVYGKVMLSYDNFEEKYIETIKNKINDADLEVRLEYHSTEGLEGVSNFNTNSPIELKAVLKNISNNRLTNVFYEVVLPEKYIVFDDLMNIREDITYEVKYNANNTILRFSIPFLNSNEKEELYFSVKTAPLDYHQSSVKMIIKSFGEYNNVRYNSNTFIRNVLQSETKLDYEFNSNIENEIVQNGENIEFILKIKNLGVIDANIVTIESELPDGLIITSLSEISENSINEKDFSADILSIEMKLAPGEEKSIKMNTIVESKLFVLDQQSIDVGFSIDYSGENLKTNIISYKIQNEFVSYSLEKTEENEEIEDLEEDDNEEDLDEEFFDDDDLDDELIDEEEEFDENLDYNDNDAYEMNENELPNEDIIIQEKQNEKIEPIRTYYISGIAWVDKNQDGIRQENEKLQSGIIAKLYKANSDGGLDTSNAISTTATDETGRYTFSKVEPGNYIIVFDYQSDKYKITKYQVSTAKTTENSDVVSKNITLDGQVNMCAVTDVLEVNNSSLVAIDIGLVDKTNFDLRLEKGISQVKVINNDGIKIYDYNKIQNARLDIRAKEFKTTVLEITYSFKVINEGDFSGYANKIVDYLPEDMQVDLNKSPGWYIGSDNGLYYTGLLDQEIGVETEKEFSLVVTKSLEKGDAVKLVNSAEIVEITNAQGLDDRDSIENNKIEQEDDYGIAVLMVSVATGNVPQYITIVLLLIIMVTSILIMVIKLIKTKKIYK